MAHLNFSPIKMKLSRLLLAITNPKEYVIRFYIRVTYRIVRIIDGITLGTVPIVRSLHHQ